MSLKNKTIIVTGGSRGIGRSIAIRCARDGANVVLAAKTVAEEGQRKGTIYSVAKEVERAGGRALPIQVDVRFEDQVQNMVEETRRTFGSIYALVNNAGAINFTPLEELTPKRMDIMLDVNLRAVLLCTHFCIPAFKEAGGGHVINLSPPLSLDSKWFGNHTVYTVSKFGMSLATLGLAQELKPHRIAVNALWPRTIIASAAIGWLMGEEGRKQSRTPEITADAAYEILTSDFSLTGNLFLDEPLLKERGYTDFKKYRVDPQTEPALDLYVEK